MGIIINDILNMMRTHTQHDHSVRHRRIGRKVLLADRISRAMDSGSSNRWISLKSFFTPKRIMLTTSCLLLVAVLGFSGARMYNDQVAAAQKIQATEQQRILKANSAEADACRRKKVEQKADQLGKITYDQM